MKAAEAERLKSYKKLSAAGIQRLCYWKCKLKQAYQNESKATKSRWENQKRNGWRFSKDFDRTIKKHNKKRKQELQISKWHI